MSELPVDWVYRHQARPKLRHPVGLCGLVVSVFFVDYLDLAHANRHFQLGLIRIGSGRARVPTTHVDITLELFGHPLLLHSIDRPIRSKLPPTEEAALRVMKPVLVALRLSISASLVGRSLEIRLRRVRGVRRLLALLS